MDIREGEKDGYTGGREKDEYKQGEIKMDIREGEKDGYKGGRERWI